MRFFMCYKKSCNKNNDSNDHSEERFMAQETLGCQVYLGFNFFFFLISTHSEEIKIDTNCWHLLSI